MRKIKCYLFWVFLCFGIHYCQGQTRDNENIYDQESIFRVTDTMLTLSTYVDNSLIKWQSGDKEWEIFANNFYQTHQMLDSAVSFAKKDSNCMYVIIRHVTSYWKTVKPGFSNTRTKLFKDYLIWNGVDPMSIWISLDTICNCKPIEYSENCLHYYQVKKVNMRRFCGWIKEGGDNFLSNAYLYGIVTNNCFGGQQEIGRSDSTGRFMCYVPDVPITIVIKDESGAELMKLNIGTGQLTDKMIIDLEKRGKRKNSVREGFLNKCKLLQGRIVNN